MRAGRVDLPLDGAKIAVDRDVRTLLVLLPVEGGLEALEGTVEVFDQVLVLADDDRDAEARHQAAAIFRVDVTIDARDGSIRAQSQDGAACTVDRRNEL